LELRRARRLRRRRLRRRRAGSEFELLAADAVERVAAVVLVKQEDSRTR
jgi:hypothetical protein